MTILLWIISTPLLLFGLLGLLGNYCLILNYYYAKLRRITPLPSGSMVPLGGLILGIGILLIPLDLSPYRLLFAGVALLLDPFTWVISYLPIYLFEARMKRRTCMLITYGVLLAISTTAFLYALKMCLYCTWLTSVPPESAQARWAYWANVWLGVTLVFAAAFFVLLWRLIVAIRTLIRLRHKPGTCRVCGYDLCDSPSICPECGGSEKSYP